MINVIQIFFCSYLLLFTWSNSEGILLKSPTIITENFVFLNYLFICLFIYLHFYLDYLYF